MLTDDDLTTQLRAAYANAAADIHAPTSLAAELRRDRRTHQHRTATSLIAASTLAAAAIVATALSGNTTPGAPSAQQSDVLSSPQQSTSTDAITVQLMGYTLTVGQTDFQYVCGTESAFESGGSLRLVSDPDDPSCPVTVGLTTTAPPTNAEKITLPFGIAGYVADGPNPGGRTLYTPVPRDQGVWTILVVRSGHIEQPLLSALLAAGFPVPD